MLFGLRGALARALDFLRALPLGFAVGGVLTSGGGTGPPLAKYRFFFSANLTCIDAEHCFRGCCQDLSNKCHSSRLRPDTFDGSQTANMGDGLRLDFACLHRHANGAAACEHYRSHT